MANCPVCRYRNGYRSGGYATSYSSSSSSYGNSGGGGRASGGSRPRWSRTNGGRSRSRQRKFRASRWPPRSPPTSMRRSVVTSRRAARYLRTSPNSSPFRRLANVSTQVYTSRMKAARAKLFQNGGSQAVRLPADCRFPRGQREVIVRRVGHRVVLEPLDEWPDEFLKCLGTLSGELPRPKQAPIAKLRDPFE